MSDIRDTRLAERAAERTLAGRNLAAGAFLLVPVSAGAALMAGNSLLLIVGAAFVFAAMAAVGAHVARDYGRILIVVGLIGQAICLTAALAGHPWQLDSHMLFFALLAVCMVLSDPAAILTAAGLIVVHHLSLTVFLPALVYPSASLLIGVERTAIHGAVVALQTFVIWRALRKRNADFEAQIEAEQRIFDGAAATEEALVDTRDAKAQAETALKDAKVATAKAEAAQAKAEAETIRAQELDAKSRERDAEESAKLQQIHDEQNRVVDALRAGLKMLASGDLSAPITEDFGLQYRDLRDDYNAALRALKSAMTQVDASARAMTEGIGSISKSADNLATRTESQSATLEETAAAIAQIAASAKSAADSARKASRTVETAKGKADKSKQIVRDAVQSMSAIEESSGQISRIVELIESIAFQTNLLALNAGVEAARAGDAGRGFSVVASEVRGLALRSSEAAKEIAGLIDTSEKQITNGADLVRQTGAALEDIVVEVDDLAQHMAEIANSAQEQSSAVSESDHAMRVLETATQQNATMFEETNAITQVLGGQARQLSVAMAGFVMDEKDGGQTPRHVA